ncbi:hypothetical protein VaNZ11_013332 [Volvox africanus]|uniref:C2H2-type domain-containing protein n=1 Tax=Volvox africanus TaxID=51714 RepID=A0ABQ5SHN0_9CHLO|nr:hypothetical protein VaNZ11_013332 [Volvox africanus]
MEERTQTLRQPIPGLLPRSAAAVGESVGAHLYDAHSHDMNDGSSKWQSVPARTARWRQQAARTQSQQKAMVSRIAYEDDRNAVARSPPVGSVRTGMARAGSTGLTGTTLPATGAEATPNLRSPSLSSAAHGHRSLMQQPWGSLHLGPVPSRLAASHDESAGPGAGSSRPQYQVHRPSTQAWTSTPSQQQNRHPQQPHDEQQQSSLARLGSRHLASSRLLPEPTLAGRPSEAVPAPGQGQEPSANLCFAQSLLGKHQRQQHATIESRGLQEGNGAMGPARDGHAGTDAGGSSRGGPSAALSSAIAALQERLLVQARRSAFDPTTGKVRCRACGKAFATYAQLAQHLTAAHDGINSEDAKYLQFKRQQQQQEQMRHQEQQYLQPPQELFPNLQVLQQKQHAQLPQPLWSTIGSIGRQGRVHDTGRGLHGTDVGLTEAAFVAPAVFSATAFPTLSSDGAHVTQGPSSISISGNPIPTFPSGVSTPLFQHEEGSGRGRATPQPGAPKLDWPTATGGACSVLPATMDPEAAAAAAAVETSTNSTPPATILNAWSSRRLRWQTVSTVSSESSSTVPGGSGSTLVEASARFTVGPPKAGARGARRTAASAVGGAGVPAPPTATTAACAPVKRSKRAVTLAELLSVAMPAARGDRPTAATARGLGIPGASGTVVRISNSLRVVMKGPAVKSQTQHPKNQNAVGTGAAPVAPGMRRVLTAAGTVAVTRKKHLSRAKKLILQHRATRTLAEAADAYQRARQSYLSVAGVYGAMQTELTHLQREGKEGLVLGSSAAGVPTHRASVPTTAVKVNDGGTATAVQNPASSAAEAPMASRASSAARGISASANPLPPSLRPQLLMLALAKARPLLESLHKTLVRRRTAYVAKLKHHAVVHRQGEPSEAELAGQAPLDPLPVALGTEARSGTQGSGSATDDASGGDGVGTGLSGSNTDSEDSDSKDEALVGGFQDVLRRWAELLGLPDKLCDFETSPRMGSLPTEPPQGPCSLPSQGDSLLETKAPVGMHLTAPVRTPSEPGPSQGSTATIAPAAAGSNGAATDSIAAGNPKSERRDQPHLPHRPQQQQASVAIATECSSATPTSAPAPAPAPAPSQVGLSTTMQAKRQLQAQAVGPSAGLVAPQSSLPAWLAPSGDSSDEEEDSAQAAGPTGLFSAAGAGMLAWGRPSAVAGTLSGIEQSVSLARKASKPTGSEGKAADVAKKAEEGSVGPNKAVSLASTTGPLALPSGSLVRPSGCISEDGGDDSEDDFYTEDADCGPGWTDVLSKWRSKVNAPQTTALPVFMPTATGKSAGSLWTAPSSSFMVTTAAASPGSTAAKATAPMTGRMAANLDPPAAQPANVAAAALVAPVTTTPVSQLNPVAVGHIAAPGAFTHMGLPAPCPSLFVRSTAATAAAAAVFASAAAALAPAAAAEEGDDGDEAQLSPKAATAAAALILQRQDVMAHVQQAQARMHAQIEQAQKQSQSLANAGGAQVGALLAAASAADGSSGVTGRDNRAAGMRAQPEASPGPAPPAALGMFGNAPGSLEIASTVGGGAGAVESAPPSAAGPVKSSWMQSVMGDSDDDDDEDDDLQDFSGGVKVDVLASWMSSASLPTMTELFKRHQQLLKQQQQYVFPLAPYTSASAAATGVGSGLSAKQAVLGKKPAPAGGGSGGTATTGPVLSPAQAPGSSSSSAGAGSAAGPSIAPAAGIKVVHRAVSGPHPQAPQTTAASEHQPRRQQQQQQVRRLTGSSIIGPASTTAAAVTASTAATTAAIHVSPHHSQFTGAGVKATAKSTVQLLTRAGIVGGPSLQQPTAAVPSPPSPAVKTGQAAGPAATNGAAVGVSAAAAVAGAPSQGASRGRQWLATPQIVLAGGSTSAPLSATSQSRTDEAPDVAPGHTRAAASPALIRNSSAASPSLTAGGTAATLTPGVAEPARETQKPAAAVAPANAWSRPLLVSGSALTHPQGLPPERGVKQQCGTTAASHLALSPAAAVGGLVSAPARIFVPEAAHLYKARAGHKVATSGGEAEAEAEAAASAASARACDGAPQTLVQHPETAPTAQQQQQQQELPPEFKCELCQVHCNSRWTFEQHCASRKHAMRAANAGWTSPQLAAADHPPQGTACQEGTDAGAGGRAAHRATAGPATVTDAAAASPYACTLCGVACNSEMTYQQHLASRKHLGRAARLLLQQALPGDGSHLPQQPSPFFQSAVAGSKEDAAELHGGRDISLGAGPSIGPVSSVVATMSRTNGGNAGATAGAPRTGSAPAALAWASALGTAEVAGSNRQGGATGPVVHPAQPHRLCQQLLVSELDALVLDTLTRIRGFQERAMARNAIKAAAHRWYVLGLREVHKAVRTKRAKVVVIAPNIEEVAAEGGLDTTLQAILDMCTEQETVAVFALSRKQLGRVYGFKKRVSAVAILELNGIHEAYADIAKLAKRAKEGWRDCAAATSVSIRRQEAGVKTDAGPTNAACDSDGSQDVPDEDDGEEEEEDKGEEVVSASPDLHTRREQQHAQGGERCGAVGLVQRDPEPSPPSGGKSKTCSDGSSGADGRGKTCASAPRLEVQTPAAECAGACSSGTTAVEADSNCTATKMLVMEAPTGGDSSRPRLLNAAAPVFVPRFAV